MKIYRTIGCLVLILLLLAGFNLKFVSAKTLREQEVIYFTDFSTAPDEYFKGLYRFASSEDSINGNSLAFESTVNTSEAIVIEKNKTITIKFDYRVISSGTVSAPVIIAKDRANDKSIGFVRMYLSNDKVNYHYGEGAVLDYYDSTKDGRINHVEFSINSGTEGTYFVFTDIIGLFVLDNFSVSTEKKAKDREYIIKRDSDIVLHNGENTHSYFLQDFSYPNDTEITVKFLVQTDDSVNSFVMISRNYAKIGGTGTSGLHDASIGFVRLNKVAETSVWDYGEGATIKYMNTRYDGSLTYEVIYTFKTSADLRVTNSYLLYGSYGGDSIITSLEVSYVQQQEEAEETEKTEEIAKTSSGCTTVSDRLIFVFPLLITVLFIKRKKN
jgi:hypothetical protein